MSPARKARQSLDAYIRVSRVGNRKGSSYISPTVQRDDIERWADANGVSIEEIVVEEDVSGSKSIAARDLGRLIEKCERGDSDGIVVYRVDRFSRSPRDTFEAIERLEKVGARLVGSNDGHDSSTPTGEVAIGILATMARQQWLQRRDNWAEATKRAVADGVHISAQPPTGYKRKGKRSRLEVDPEVAPLVKECFRRRARGESWLRLAEYLSDNGVPMSKSGMTGVIKNRVYLGEARGPNGIKLAEAHEPLVTVEEWEAAQKRGRVHAKTGTIAAQGMLSGLITCASCGNRLSVTGTTNRSTGERVASYFCKGHSAKGRCPAPAAARVRIADTYVAAALSQAIVDGTLKATMDSVSRYRRAVDAVAREEQALRDLADLDLFKRIGAEEYAEMARQQEEAVEQARSDLRNTPTPDEAIEPTTDLWDPEAWPIERQRLLARQFIAAVSLEPGRKRRWSPPIQERIEIRWAGHDEPDFTIFERMARFMA